MPRMGTRLTRPRRRAEEQTVVFLTLLALRRAASGWHRTALRLRLHLNVPVEQVSTVVDIRCTPRLAGRARIGAAGAGGELLHRLGAGRNPDAHPVKIIRAGFAVVLDFGAEGHDRQLLSGPRP